jgi:hypothetical protein
MGTGASRNSESRNNELYVIDSQEIGQSTGDQFRVDPVRDDIIAI